MTDRRDGDDDDGAFGDGGGARGGGWKYSKSRHFIIFRGGEEVNNTRRGTNGDGCKCPPEKKKKGPPIKQSQCAFVLNYQNGTLCHRTTTEEGGGNLYFWRIERDPNNCTARDKEIALPLLLLGTRNFEKNRVKLNRRWFCF